MYLDIVIVLPFLFGNRGLAISHDHILSNFEMKLLFTHLVMLTVSNSPVRRVRESISKENDKTNQDSD